ncbi:MAG TPA: mechanosensitive ion channel domain-containing protein [Chitinophagaceae bacterium]|jgi:MscS family membrane protein|nr:mechanosensitive ion channel domain-containing protein [Chitinophagaceae bacterium]
MNSFLQQLIFGNTVFDYLWSLGIIVFVLLVNRLLSRFLASLLCRLIKKKWKAFDQNTFIDLVLQPLSVFLLITVSIVALYRLNFPRDLNIMIYKYSLQRIFLSVAILTQIAAFTWLLLRIIDFVASILEKRAALTPDQADNQLIVFFRDLVKVILGIVGLLMILHFAFNYNVSSLLTGLSIVGAAIALALRESLENLIASFVIFFDKPFTTGDAVRVQQVSGIVEKIGLRSTRIRSDQKTYVSVPNKQMVDSILDNISLRTQQRNELMLQISLDTPSAKIEALINELKGFLSNIEELQLYNVFFVDINVQAYAIMIEFFLPAAYLSQFNNIKQQLNLFAIQTIEKMEIKIAGADKEVVVR